MPVIDLALGQMSVAHQPPAAIIGELVGIAAEQARNLGLDGLRQNRSRAVAQNLGQRIAKSSWLRELENISVGHGVSLLCWRSGGVEHPHDTPPSLSRRHQLSPIALGLFDWLFCIPPRLRKHAVDRLSLKYGDCVLEVGCGSGRNFPFLR